MNLGRLTTAVALAACTTGLASAAILIDYDDGTAGGGHDAAVLEGDFTGMTTSDLTPWADLSTGGSQILTNNNSGVGSNQNFAITLDRVLGVDTGHTIASGESYNMSFMWRDAANWDAPDTVQLVLFYTADNTIAGTATDIATLNSGSRATTGAWETEAASGVALADGGAVGKTLFARLESTGLQGEFSRIDNVFVEVVPEPGSIALLSLGGLALLRRRR